MTSDDRGPADSALDRLLRWEEFGGHWRIGARTGSRLQIALLTCDGGEIADFIETGDEAVIAHVAGRSTDQDDVGARRCTEGDG
ncbi:MAG TPA: hypothetical protein VHX15_05735 [Frankiaceae bacterium]|jgi:hypothetical protein|nr:hypothetical protein [Frankiaceae bacterium]